MYMNKKLKTRPFLKRIKKQHVTKDILRDALHQCNTDCPFSTFPYFTHHMTSKQALEQFSSGNCVALTLFIKQLLKKKHGLKSHIIPATIPNIVRGQRPYLDICHVALAVPKNRQTIYILDPAFYMLEPMRIDTNNDEPETGQMKNIFTNTIDSIIYTRNRLKKKERLNKYQTIARNTHKADCYYEHNPDERWTYYLTEVLNPDHAISKHFLSIRKHPWITINDANYKTTHFIKILPNKAIKIESNGDLLYEGPIIDIPPHILNYIKPHIIKYLGETAHSFHIPEDFFFFESPLKTRRRPRRRPRRRARPHSQHHSRRRRRTRRPRRRASRKKYLPLPTPK